MDRKEDASDWSGTSSFVFFQVWTGVQNVPLGLKIGTFDIFAPYLSLKA